jgi:hypothetical protein
LGEAVCSCSEASHARNVCKVSLHDCVLARIWERNSQKTREGGKESSTGWISEILGEVDPRGEHFFDVRGGGGLKLLHMSHEPSMCLRH